MVCTLIVTYDVLCGLCQIEALHVIKNGAEKLQQMTERQKGEAIGRESSLILHYICILKRKCSVYMFAG